MTKREWCAICADVIGVYEPLVVLDQPPRPSSLAAEPALHTAASKLVHVACAIAHGHWPGDGHPEHDGHTRPFRP